MHSWRVGTVVTRTGEDEQMIYTEAHSRINEQGNRVVDYWMNNMDIVCIKADSQGIYKVGDTESNLTRRYDFKYHLVNWKNKLKEIGREDLIKEQV